MAIEFNVNGKPEKVDVDPSMPLLWVLRDTLGMTGTKFGCAWPCAAPARCISTANLRAPALLLYPRWRGRESRRLKDSRQTGAIPCSGAWIELEVPQCGYCQSGQLMSASGLLAKHPQPTDTQIDEAMTGNICRCGTYQRIREAIHRAAKLQSAANHKPDTVTRRGTFIECAPAQCGRGRCGMSVTRTNLDRRGFLKLGSRVQRDS